MTTHTMDKKLNALKEFFAENKKVALAFSGGVDSSCLLYAAKENGCDIHPYFIKTKFQPEFELEDAKRIAGEMGIELKVVEYDILSENDVRANGKDRCYYCKSALFGAIKGAAHSAGLEVIIDGTNASDDYSDRPGMRALEEMSILSPLRLCGFEKQEIRELCKKAGLFIWDKPAYACLATRIPTGETITAEALGKVEKAEDYMASLGFSDFRVRYFNGAAKVQLKKEQLEKAILLREKILGNLSEYFDDVLLDFKIR